MQDCGDSDPLINETWKELKRGIKPRWRYFVVKLSIEDDVENSVFELDHRAPVGESYSSIFEHAPDQHTRWSVLNIPYTLVTGAKKSKIVFVSWVPDTIHRASFKDSARVKSFGVMAMGGLKKRFVEVSVVVQANGLDDLDLREVLMRCGRFEREAVDYDLSLAELTQNLG